MRIPTHTMNLLYRLASKTLRSGDHLTYSQPSLLRIERRLPSERRLVISVWNLPKSGFSYDRYICGGGKASTYFESNSEDVSAGVAHLLRIPMANRTELDDLAQICETMEISDLEAYWPTDARTWPLAEALPYPDQR